MKTPAIVDPSICERPQLIQEASEVNNDAIADDAVSFQVQYPRGNQMKFVFVAVDNNCMPGVGTSTDSGAYVVIL